MSTPYPNWQKRIHVPDACYFVTCNTRDFHHFFREPILCDVFAETLRQCKENRKFELYGWSLGYDHFHSSIRPMGNDDISKIMHGLKRNASRNINFVMGSNAYDEPSMENADNHPHLRQGDWDAAYPISERADENPHLAHAPERADENPHFPNANNFIYIKWILKFRFKIKYLNRIPFQKFEWKKSFIDHYCRDERDFRTHLKYIAYNPTKHHLPKDWPYVFTNPKYESWISEW